MAKKIDIIAPQIEQGSSALTLSRWLKMVGDPVHFNEPIAEIFGAQTRGYVHAPDEGTISILHTMPGQNVLSGALMGQIAVVSKNALDWDNFDHVTDILESFADKSKSADQLKDANEALGQLLGVADKDVFRNMSIEQQNKFLQNIVDQHAQGAIGSAQVAQKLLEGLYLRSPQISGPAVRGPSFGMAAPTPGGMGGGAPRNMHQQQWPPQQMPHGYPPVDPYHSGPQFGHNIPPPHVPHMPSAPHQLPPILPTDDEETK